jgi:hypothetical protein
MHQVWRHHFQTCPFPQVKLNQQWHPEPRIYNLLQEQWDHLRWHHSHKTHSQRRVILQRFIRTEYLWWQCQGWCLVVGGSISPPCCSLTNHLKLFVIVWFQFYFPLWRFI